MREIYLAIKVLSIDKFVTTYIEDYEEMGAHGIAGIKAI